MATSDLAISVSGLSKRYLLRHQVDHSNRYRYKRFSDVLINLAKKPGQRLAQARPAPVAAAPQSVEEFWALNDVSFSVKRGEVVGIIGRNGAGKSTLLKILSRITEPTRGRVEIEGRVASLLEVGTGFHPELTGRENVFLNGAILGMARSEIRQRFDEIVEFAELSKFVDTPVKRYSSGMYMRLAFAVAAHLEPEILIIDEVLAVGDAEFQKKCLGKLQDVASGEGRSVLFVSHNMQAVAHLCSSAILLKSGRIAAAGEVQGVIDAYMSAQGDHAARKDWTYETAPAAPDVRVKSVRCCNADGEISGDFMLSEAVRLEIEFWIVETTQINVSFHLYNQYSVNVFATANLHHPVWGRHVYSPGLYKASCVIPKHLLAEGQHDVKVYISGGGNSSIVKIELPEVVSFTMRDDGFARGEFLGHWMGTVRPLLEWEGQLVSASR